MTDKYNGWTNYETWAVNLWLSNDEPTYRQVRNLCLSQNDEYKGSTRTSSATTAITNRIHRMLTIFTIFDFYHFQSFLVKVLGWSAMAEPGGPFGFHIDNQAF